MRTYDRDIAGFLIRATIVLLSGCSPSANPPASATVPAEHSRVGGIHSASEENPSSWVGVYSSPSEVGGFSGTVLSIERMLTTESLSYRMTFSSDLGGARGEKHGWPLVEGDRLYLPVSSQITRYRRVNVKGHTVLMEDEALRAFREQNRLYDYGILIKVLDKGDPFLNLTSVKHESIKVLYQNATAPWQDPFVHGPNAR